jgi:subtilisin family serine protease
MPVFSRPWLAFLTLTLVIAGTAIAIRAQQPRPRTPAVVPNEFLVRYRDATTAAGRNFAVSASGAALIRRFAHVAVDHVRLPAGVPAAAAINALRANDNVLSVDPNYIRSIVATSPPNDPYWLDNSLWGLNRISAQPAWTNFTTGSSGIVAADIDTGVNYYHPDLAANIWTNPGEIPGNGIDDDGNGYVDDVHGIDTYNLDSDPMDDHGHGTRTAGTIGARGNNAVGVVGVSWNVKILACKFIGASGEGNDGGAIACLNYIIAEKNRGVNVRVTNNSWGARRVGSPSHALKAAFDAAGNAGILNVVAAGNEGVDIDLTPFDPASFDSPSIVAVAASDTADNPAGFSNYGVASVDIAAPGVSILSTVGSGYAYGSGTSMATPHVAGAAALLLSRDSSLTVNALKNALLNSVDHLSQWSNLVVSGGRLNVYTALTLVTPNIAPSVSVIAPLEGQTLTAGTAMMLAASANDPDGTIDSVAFFVDGNAVGTDATSPFSVSWPAAAAGSHTVTAIATDNLGASTTSAPVHIDVTAPLGRVNVALARNGATALASSSYSSSYDVTGAINGDRTGDSWGSGGGWNDGTPNAFPDWLEIDFAGVKTIDQIDVFTVQDTYWAPSEPTSTMTFTLYGIRDFEVQYWTGTDWLAITGGSVSGNALVWRQFVFDAISTSRIRVLVISTPDAWSRITEVEAYETDTGGSMMNFALAANGGAAFASSTYSAGYPSSGAIDGDRRGDSWQSGGGWNDGTSSDFPDWLEIDFAGPRTITEINVFTVQDTCWAPSDPTPSMTFSLYGLTEFVVQYWDGTAWVVVPGGNVAGNNLVWRQFLFAPLTTTRIRVLVTSSADQWSRITEVEARGPGQ